VTLPKLLRDRKGRTDLDDFHWCTPQPILDVAYAVLGSPVDLDPASSAMSIVKARRTLDGSTEETDGLAVSWGVSGSTVWLNPPYGSGYYRDTFVPSFPALWLDKCVAEARRAVSMCVLIPAKVETAAHHDLVSQCSAYAEIRGRVRFIDPSTGEQAGCGRFASQLVYFGPRWVEFRARADAAGWWSHEGRDDCWGLSLSPRALMKLRQGD